MNDFAKIAVQNAVRMYSESSGLSISEVLEEYKSSASVQYSIALLVLAQSDPVKLRPMGDTL